MFWMTFILIGALSVSESIIDETVMEGIKHYDDALRSYMVRVQQRNTYYRVPWEEEQLDPPFQRIYVGSFATNGFLKEVVKIYSRLIETGDVKEDMEVKVIHRRVFDGKKIVEEIEYRYPDRSREREYHIFPPPPDFRPFKSEEFDPKYWLGLYGTPISKVLTSNRISDLSFKEERVNGEKCYRIKVRKPYGSVEFLINTERGYRPQEIIQTRGKERIVIQISLARYSDLIWYPERVIKRKFVGPLGKEKLVLEKELRFTQFKGNEEIPPRRFRLRIDKSCPVFDHR